MSPPKPNTSTALLLVLLVLVVAVHAARAAPVVTMERPHRNDVSSVADAIRYLQELDQYYGQISRPRFGKRNGPPLVPRRQPAAEDNNNRRYQVDTDTEEDWTAKLFNERR